MAPKITGHIDHLTEHEFDQIREAGPGSRFEVMLDRTDGDHHELEAHFRLVELTATRQWHSPQHPVHGPHYPDSAWDRAAEQAQKFPVYQVETTDAAGLIKRTAELLAHLIHLEKINPRVMGICDDDAPLEERIERYLRS